MSVPTAKERVDTRREVTSAIGIKDLAAFAIPKLHLPMQLTPAIPKQNGAYLDMYQALMVLSEQPVATGMGLFSSQMQWPVYPEVSASFPRQHLGESYLIEFHVELIKAGTTYSFRIFDWPLEGFEDVSVPGGGTQVFTHLVPPVDEIPEADDPVLFGASIQQRNDENDQAAWFFYSAHISVAD
jgi:hypothetical protein